MLRIVQLKNYNFKKCIQHMWSILNQISTTVQSLTQNTEDQASQTRRFIRNEFMESDSSLKRLIVDEFNIIRQQVLKCKHWCKCQSTRLVYSAHSARGRSFTYCSHSYDSGRDTSGYSNIDDCHRFANTGVYFWSC